ncbi:hypothetical protein D3C71_1360080 [compost metagenome]
MIATGRFAGATRKSAGDIASDESRDDTGDDKPEASGDRKRRCFRIVGGGRIEDCSADADAEQVEEELDRECNDDSSENRAPGDLVQRGRGRGIERMDRIVVEMSGSG